jgi:translation initiation factor 1
MDNTRYNNPTFSSDPLSSLDEFNDTTKVFEFEKKKCYISVQQRNARKNITIVYGLDDDLDVKKIMNAMKKEFACNGSVKKNKDYGEVIQLQGDKRNDVCQWLYEHHIYEPSEERVIITGA